MYAVIKTGGKQYRVSAGMKVVVEKLTAEVGSGITINEVLMLGGSEAGVKLGTPTVTGASVSATVLAHGQGEKVHIFKHRRRKHYKKSQGHRQLFTQLEITAINA
jgi:large subunit ribosomal protein L21